MTRSNGGSDDPLVDAVREYGPAIRAFCRRELGDATLADDVSQEVFVQAIQDPQRFAERSKQSLLRAWLFAIARHRVLDAVRRRKREIERFLPTSMTAIPDPGPPLGDRLEESRLHRALRESVRTIDERTRTALLLHYEKGFTFKKMAEMLAVRPNTLQVRMSRALPKLRNRMEAYREDVSA
ncbi:MAG TPA: RNA polymerase sigma factor [Kofleriaceae bacterium]|nr:RNA polymerase sigma factor [Kofleriaceae bacterium]